MFIRRFLSSTGTLTNFVQTHVAYERILMMLFLCHLNHVSSQSPTKMELTAPVNPVKQSEIFSLHCQVWNLKPGHEVAIFKNESGTNMRLSVNNQLTSTDDGERTFLAERNLNDGSKVYFLSIVNVVSSDAGMYTCKIINTGSTLLEVATASKILKIMRLPNDDNLKCSLDPYLTTVNAGSKLSMTCKTEETFPLVNIRWSRTGNGHVPSPRETVQNGVVVSKIEFVPTEEDNDSTMFLCEITSPAFPSFFKTCHVGPFIVNPDPQKRSGEDEWMKTSKSGIPNAGLPKPSVTSKVNLNYNDKLNCQQTECSAMSPEIFFWVISTAIAGITCCIFLIACIIIYYKYIRLTTHERKCEQPQHFQRPPMEYIYTDIDVKRDSNYMSLERPKGLRIVTVK